MNDVKYYICKYCANKKGAVWPLGYVSTFVNLPCDWCYGDNQLLNEGVAPWIDYNWPGQDKKDLEAKINRD